MKLRFLSIPTVIDTYWRFPLPLLCGAALFVLILDERHGLWSGLVSDDTLDRLAAILFVGIFFHWALALAPAASGRAKALWSGAGLAIHLAFGVSVFALPPKALIWPVTSACAVGLLLVAVAPFLRRRDDLSFWQFNRIVWQGLGIAAAAGVLLAGGVSVGLLGIEELFGIDIRSRVYGDIWSFAFLIIVPLHALSFVPATTHFPEQECRAPRPLSVIIDWIMAPLALAYMLILYAYFIKIGIAWELPKGILAYLVTAFGGFGIVTYLVGWPMRADGGPLLRVFYKAFIPAMVIPVALQAVAIYQRVDAYGLTENRIAIIVATLWFALVLAARLFKPLPLVIIPGLLALLLAVVVAGPFSAYHLAVGDQTSRLDAILARHGMLQGDRIVHAAAELPAEDRAKISSIATFLVRRGATEDLQRRIGVFWDHPTAQQITKAMGFAHLSEWERRNPPKNKRIQIGTEPDSVPTAGYDILLQKKIFRPLLKTRGIEIPGWTSMPTVHAKYENGTLTYAVTGKGEVSLEILPLLLAEAAKKEEDRSLLIVAEGENERFRIKTFFWASAWLDSGGEARDGAGDKDGDADRDGAGDGDGTNDGFRLDALHYLTLFAEKDGG